MFKMRCLVCGSPHTKKNGVRTGVQLYKCQECGYQFRSRVDVSKDELWDAYLHEKQTISELSCRFGVSVATIKRRLHDIKLVAIDMEVFFKRAGRNRVSVQAYLLKKPQTP